MTYQELKTLAESATIEPHRCHRCHNTKASGLSWQYGYDAGTDPNYLGYQCLTCGNIQGLTGAYIRRQARSR
jgi:hypothetical protein